MLGTYRNLQEAFHEFWILELGICRCWRSLIIVVCKVPALISNAILLGSTKNHPSWDRIFNGWRRIYRVCGWWLIWESIIIVSEFNYLYFEVWVGCDGWFICG